MLNRYRENNEPFTIYLDVSDTDSDPFATWAASIESMLENAVKLDNSGDGGVIDQLEQLGFDASTINQLVDTATEIILASENTDSLRGLEEMIMEGLLILHSFGGRARPGHCQIGQGGKEDS